MKSRTDTLTGVARIVRLGRRPVRLLTATLLLGCMGLAAWVWSLPQHLPAAQAWGAHQARAEASRRLGEQRPPDAAADGLSPLGADVKAWRNANRAEFERTALEAAERYRDRYSYRGDDGRDHVYLGDYDSYYWLHFARKLLRSGSLCDPGDPDRCLDAQGHAPVGAPLAYPRSAHVFAIAALHGLVDGCLSPGYPLAASAMLVPVVVAVLGVLPAFFLGRLLAGNLGGLVGAVAISLHPLFLQRSLGGDNDVWNLVLPLYMIWAATAALSGGRLRPTLFAILAGAVAGLHATIWQGWVFTYVVVAAGLFAYLAIQTIHAVRAGRSFRVWRHASVRSSAATLLVFYAAAGVFTTLASVDENYVAIPLKAFWSAVGPLLHPEPGPAAGVLAWPDTLGTVQELRRPTLGMIASTLGGRVFMLIGLVGLLMAYFPRGEWRIRHYGLLFVGVASYTLALASPALDRGAGLALVALPPLAGGLLSVLERHRPTPAQALAIILLLWFLGTLYLSYGGLRYVFFLAPAFGLALAAGVGRFHEWLGVLADAWLGRYRNFGASVAFILLSMVLVIPVSVGIRTARAYVPAIDDVWWDSLTALRKQSDPGSIVTVWWDYGHWAKYVTDRRVTADGTSLLTHLPHWVAKALTSPNPRESVGVLRMLDCASEATPLPEGMRGAYGRIMATGRDDLDAYTTVSALTVRTRAQAAAYLTDWGFSDDEQTAILAATHCTPPEAYLVLSTEMLKKARSLVSVGLSDPRKSALADRFEKQNEVEAQTWLAAEFGYARTEASDLYHRVWGQEQRAGTDFVDSAWRPCREREEDGALECPFRFYSNDASKAGTFRYREGDRPEATFQLETAMKGAMEAASGPPGLLLLARNDRLERVEFLDTPYAEMAVLVDRENARILIGTPAFLRSTLVQLLFLDGRYTKYFRKISEHGAYPEETVSVWRIDWRQANAGGETR